MKDERQTTQPNTLQSIKAWHEAARPEPTLEHLTVQLGCHLEEVAEMLATLPVVAGHGEYVRWVTEVLADIGYELKKKELALRTPSLDEKIALLDALCDQIVTAVGVAHCAGVDIMGGLAEVDRSNWSKFVDGKPVFDRNGKITKGPNYVRPCLSGFVW